MEFQNFGAKVKDTKICLRLNIQQGTGYCMIQANELV